MTDAEIEMRIARRIVREALKAGYNVSVVDGEELVVERSTKQRAIMAALRTTDYDYLHINQIDDGRRIGFVMLVWGEGEDVVADHSDTMAMNALMERAGQGG